MDKNAAMHYRHDMGVRAVLIFSILVFMVSCSSRPRLYPNKKYKKVGKEMAENDIDRCVDEADDFIDSPAGKKIVKRAGAGAVIGGAIGLVGGLFSGDVTGGLARGAAIGAAGGGAAGGVESMDADQVERAYVNHCLRKKGYHVLGWN